jgi:vacuolar protein sorting-associated protein 45
MLDYCGETRRAPGLFSGGGIISNFTKKLNTSINGVENVYTQHQPALYYILDSLAKGKIKDSVFPPLYVGGAQPSSLGGGGSISGSGGGVSSIAGGAGNRPSEVLVFIVGGATYEEACKVAEFNLANPSLKVMLGGSCVHNSTSFIKEVSTHFAR